MSMRVRVAGLAIALAAVVGLVRPGIASDLLPSTKSGHFVTQTGTTELSEGRLVLDVRKSKTGDLTVQVTLILPDTNLMSDYTVTSKLSNEVAAWFVYTDDGQRFWLYDGREVGLMRMAVEQGQTQGNVAVTTFQKSYQAADAVLINGAPKAVRDPLPKELLELPAPGK